MKPFSIQLCLLAGLLVGCGEQHADHAHSDSAHSDQAEGHTHSAPHGGLLVVLAEEFAHLELLHDPATGDLRAYALGGHAETPVRLTQVSIEIEVEGIEGTLSLKAVPSALSGESVGDTSEFHLRDAKLKGVDFQAGVIQKVEMLGQQFESIAFSGDH